jgi:hypothetical protein
VPAGLQVWNNQSYTQIDGSTTHTILLRSGSVTTTALPPGLVIDGNNYSQCAVTLNPGEILAFGGNGAVAHAGSAGNTAYLHVMAPPGSPVLYWVFGSYVPSGLNYGLQVFNESGAMIYDSGRLPIRVVGEVMGVGTFTGYPSGRQLALVPWTQHAILTRSSAPGGQFGVVLLQTTTTGFARVDYTGTVFISDATYLRQQYLYQIQTGQGEPNGWSGSFDNLLQNKYTVIDVTGY